MPTNEDNLTRHLDHGRYGEQQLNPDEQNIYLGAFKERVYYTMTVAQLKEGTYLPNWKQALKKYPRATLLLNGALAIELLTPYLKLAHQYNFAVQLKTNDRYLTNLDSNAIVLINNDIVTHPAQNINTIELVSETKSKIKIPWWQKFFKGR